jgi:hypothetical protein
MEENIAIRLLLVGSGAPVIIFSLQTPELSNLKTSHHHLPQPWFRNHRLGGFCRCAIEDKTPRTEHAFGNDETF